MKNFLKNVVMAMGVLIISCLGDNLYYMNFMISNNGTLHQLNKEGTLTGFYAGISANRSSDIDFEVWFVNSTFNSFTLSTVAIKKYSESYEGRVIWSANPESPVKLNAVLEAGFGGNLELFDADGTPVWRTETYGGGESTLWMTNLGNLVVLRDYEYDNVKWHSFDALTTTLMSRRVLKPDKKLTSTITDTNLKPGPYSLEVESNTGLVLYHSTAKNKEVYWSWRSNSTFFLVLCSTGYLELGTNFNSYSPTNTLFESDCSTIQPVDQLYVGNWGVSSTVMLTLQRDGDLQVVAWNDHKNEWDTIFKLLGDKPCQLPRKCGPFRICNNVTGACEGCPPGFVDVDQKQVTLGCHQNISREQSDQSCNMDKFQELEGYDYFATSFTEPMTGNKTAEECKGRCMRNCSCQASFFLQDTQSGDTFCYIAEDVGTIQKVTDNPTLTYKAFLRVYVENSSAVEASSSAAAGTQKPSQFPGIAGGTVGSFTALVILVSVLLN